MSYQVLARKWRPKSFASMAGQEHVLQALINALDQKRLHHAYLFTGTRGVGKTTIARILAKCLNCEKGISSKPCETCSACIAIDAGRFIDLIEVDAASRTKVEDTRELLDNVQYAPSSGRFKVYLIDEVHMLSGHSFNALLKTLEEPPPHVKFLLATTDPHKLPVTVLSRCLQFNLKNLLPELISRYLATVLTAETITFEPSALDQLAQAADGSMRDALSLLDQAIAFGNGVIKTVDVHSMLGTIEDNHILDILTALSNQDAHNLLAITAKLSELGIDFQQALEALLSQLHKLAVLQAMQDLTSNPLAAKFSKEDVQLFYQIALLGRRDLPLAPSNRMGFEMVLLRMLDFRPGAEVERPPVLRHCEGACDRSNPDGVTSSNAALDCFGRKLPRNDGEEKKPTIDNWAEILEKLSLTGMTLALAQNCAVTELSDTKLELLLAAQHAPLLNPTQQQRIESALQTYFNKPIKLAITVSKQTAVQSPAQAVAQQQAAQKQNAQVSLETDPAVAYLLESFNGTMDNASIQPITIED